MLTRRRFLQYGLTATASCSLGATEAAARGKGSAVPSEARFFQRLSDGGVQCQLCFRGCRIPAGGRGFCRNRENRGGTLVSLVYGKVAALQLDPIEKEPMFHNLPGTSILCTGTAGCNFRCRFCQNWHLSQQPPEALAPYAKALAPEDIVAAAQAATTGLSFTYNEPTVFYEFMHDVAKLGRERGLNTIFHTNGSMRPEPMTALLRHMRGVTVDLKGFTADYYKDVSFAQMFPVLETLKLIKREGTWLEIVNLVIPTLNDDLRKIRDMCAWVTKNLGTDVPIHFTRFHPAYKMTHLPLTPIQTLEQAREVATAAGIQFVYIGNVPGHKHNSTFCPRCQKVIVARVHFSVLATEMTNGLCKHCGYPIPGLWTL